MSLDDVVNVTISIESAAVSLPGFGIPMLLGVHSEWGERLRYYTDTAGMLADGFLATDQIVIDAGVIMSQNPRPQRFAVGRRATPVAQVVRVTVTGNADGTYTIALNSNTLNGSVDFSYAAVGKTITEIRDALLGLINAGTEPVTAAAVSTNAIDLTADVAGIPFLVGLTAPSSGMTQASQTANVGIPEDLAAIIDYQPDWYGLLITERDDQHLITAAKAIESVRRQFAGQSNDPAIVSGPYDSGDTSTDVASFLKGLGLARTHIWFHEDDTEALAAAVFGRMLPTIPGNATWKFKELVGVTARAYTDNELANIKSKSANGYRPLAGRKTTFEGTVAMGEFIDVIHGADKLHSRIQALAFGTFMSSPKVPYTDPGIGQLEGASRTAVEESTREQFIAKDPAPVFTSPLAADITSGDKATRRLVGGNAIRFSAPLAGAIHAAEFVGTVSA